MSTNTHETIPVFVGCCAPFRFVVRENDKWEPTLEQLNHRSYDYAKLCRMSVYFDVGINPAFLGFAFDGAIIMPMSKEIKDKQSALNFINKFLCMMLLGGIYSEAVLPEDLTIGSLNELGYYHNWGDAEAGAMTRLRSSMQGLTVGTLDVIKLMTPEMIFWKDIGAAHARGKKYVDTISQLSPSLLLNGLTHYSKHQYVEALTCIWTSVEQVVDHIWNINVVKTDNKTIAGRRDFLEDYRTWPVSTRIEVLYQNGRIREEEYSLLNTARKARNAMIHSGKMITQDAVNSAVKALFRLISLVYSDYRVADSLDDVFNNLNANIRGAKRQEKRVIHPEEIKCHLPIPPIPGDTGWDGEFEIIGELQLKFPKKEQKER